MHAGRAASRFGRFSKLALKPCRSFSAAYSAEKSAIKSEQPLEHSVQCLRLIIPAGNASLRLLLRASLTATASLIAKAVLTSRLAIQQKTKESAAAQQNVLLPAC